MEGKNSLKLCVSIRLVVHDLLFFIPRTRQCVPAVIHRKITGVDPTNRGYITHTHTHTHTLTELRTTIEICVML